MTTKPPPPQTKGKTLSIKTNLIFSFVFSNSVLYLLHIFASFFSFLSLFVFIYKRKWKENHSGLYAREGSENNRPFQILDPFPLAY
jgi:hypothetical protein